ncbi:MULTISPECIES: hypothetical protein [Paracoccus]|uniref:hypothetical protein n=1 Tax=Paracoccus TaxID=265 RepID=UPI0015880A75|nr:MULTISPECIES: hypothetical protein [Paracoccus]MCJ1900464.1 hypothetical protein [Paracoccus versutus]MDF3906043.1 hypothetical protein [Paracoccus sp. AS002]
MEVALIDLPAANAQDALAKVVVYASIGVDDLRAEAKLEEILAAARALVGGAA